MDHSLRRSHTDGSRIRGNPSIPPYTCRSGPHPLRACRCSSRWRGRRVSRQPSGRALSPWGDSCMLRKREVRLILVWRPMLRCDIEESNVATFVLFSKGKDKNSDEEKKHTFIVMGRLFFFS